MLFNVFWGKYLPTAKNWMKLSPWKLSGHMPKIICPIHGNIEIGSFQILRAPSLDCLPHEAPSLQGFGLIVMH